MVKMIIMDLDGTLLNSRKEITPITEQKLIEMQQKGTILVLASGRIKNRMDRYAKQLHMDEYPSFLIEANGSCIYDYKNQTRKVLRSLENAEANEIKDFIEKNYPHQQISVVCQEHIYVREVDYIKGGFMDYNMQQMHKDNVLCPFHTLEEIDELKFKVNVYGETDFIIGIGQEIQKQFNGKYWSGRTGPFCLENVPAEISKGRAVRMLMEQFNLSKDEVYIFGDGDNDVSMMVEATGVCMANAMESVKAKVQYQTLSCDEDGIAYFLNQLE